MSRKFIEVLGSKHYDISIS